MTDARALAFRAFALATLRELIDGEQKLARDEALKAMEAGHADDTIGLTLPDGTKVATVSLTKPKDRVEITDKAAWVRYVAKHHPEHLKVAYEFERSYVGRLVVDDGEVHDPITGTVVEFAAFVPAADVAPSVRIASTRASAGSPSGKELLLDAYRRGEIAAADFLGPAALPGGSE